MNLYELSASYQQIQQMIEDGTEGLEDTIESLNDAIENKAVGYAKVIRNIEAQSKAIKEEEERLYKRRKSLDSNVKKMKESLEDAMRFNDKKRIKTDLFSFNIQKNPPSARITNEELLPKRFYVEQEPKLDKQSLVKELRESEVPGAELAQGESLRIR